MPSVPNEGSRMGRARRSRPTSVPCRQTWCRSFCVEGLLQGLEIDVFHDLNVAPALIGPLLGLSGNWRQREDFGGVGLCDQLVRRRLRFERIRTDVLEVVFGDDLLGPFDIPRRRLVVR